MSDIDHVQGQAMRNALLTRSCSKAGLAEGTNAGTIKTAAPNGAGIDYCIDGKFYHLADGDNIAMTACDEQAASTKCMYLASVDASGNVTLTKGTEVADGGDAYLPDAPANEAVIGAIKVETASTATFTSGTTDLSAAGITDTYYDLVTVIPDAF